MNTSILDFGAAAGTLCTSAIQAAIDACGAAGGGRVTVPAGVFSTGTIRMKSHVELHLETGAVLKASTDMADYNPLDEYPQNFSVAEEEKWVGKHLIIGVNVEDVAITGFGTLDGSADAFLGEPARDLPWTTFIWRDGIALSKDPDVLRPGQLIALVESSHIRVQDVTLRNLPCWGCFLHGCENVQIRGIRVFNPPYYANSDGIDIDCCRYVTVSDCIIDTGDDAIAIRAACGYLSRPEAFPCEYITVSNCVCATSSSAFRIGVGSGVIRHVEISNIVVHRAEIAVNFMTSYPGMGGVTIEDVHISNVTAVNVSRAFCMGGAQGMLRHISLDNFRCEAMAALRIAPEAPGLFSDIALRNVEVTMTPIRHRPMTDAVREERGAFAMHFANVEDLRLEGVRVRFEKGVREQWTGIENRVGCTGRQEVFRS